MGRAAANRDRLRPMHAGKSLPLGASLTGGIHMSSITSAVSGLLTSPSFHGHGHRRGAHSTSGSSSSSSGGSSIGTLPVGVSTSLFSGLVQSFQQSLGSTSTSTSTSAVAGAGATAETQAPSAATAAATPAQGQELQAFQHSLVQALKQDGLSSNGTGNLVSSLQNLIQQVGPNGKATAATETLTSTFQNLVSGLGGAAAASSSSSSSGSANSGLQSFLNSLLQKVQAGGTASLASAGSNVDAHV
jgi:hypothetical protein